MNINEQRVREFAYQIWESEGCPMGHSERHWAMACQLAAAHDEHPHNDEPAQAEQLQADTDVPANEPVEPISPQPAQPVTPTDPIQPGEPPQQPAQPTAVTPPRKSRAKVAEDAPKSLIDTAPIALGAASDAIQKPTKRSAKPKKAKTPENESA